MTPPTPLPDIHIKVDVQYLAPFSKPDAKPARHLFAYIIRIENHSADSWQLLRRHWHVTDGLGRVTDVEGEGVVGKQPILPPQGVYVYDSLVTLEAAPGRMEGHYIFRDAWGKLGRADIAPFVLALPEGEGGRVLN